MGNNNDERKRMSQLGRSNGPISSLLQEEARNGPIPVPRKKYIYSTNMRTNRNELIRRLLSGVTTEELEYLVKLREEARSSIHPVEMLGGEARRPIPAPRKIVTQYKPIPVSRQPVPAPRTIIIWNHTR